MKIVFVCYNYSPRHFNVLVGSLGISFEDLEFLDRKFLVRLAEACQFWSCIEDKSYNRDKIRHQTGVKLVFILCQSHASFMPTWCRISSRISNLCFSGSMSQNSHVCSQWVDHTTASLSLKFPIPLKKRKNLKEINHINCNVHLVRLHQIIYTASVWLTA
jgi:hypothetical protein